MILCELAKIFFLTFSFVIFVGAKKYMTTNFLFLLLDPGSGMDKNQDPGSGMNFPDPQHFCR